ncbi:hypothetical protein J6590_094656 [Homalodisca vitripennis]|nr:hypothetical protein J6590_094656 [Homalodisca vitripennis]
MNYTSLLCIYHPHSDVVRTKLILGIGFTTKEEVWKNNVPRSQSTPHKIAASAYHPWLISPFLSPFSIVFHLVSNNLPLHAILLVFILSQVRVVKSDRKKSVSGYSTWRPLFEQTLLVVTEAIPAWTMSGAICAKNAYSIIQQSISWSQNVFQSLISLFSVPTAGMKTNICFYGGPAEAICLLLPLTGPSGTLSLANYVDWTSVRCQSLDCLACTSVEVGTCECSLLPVLKPIVHDFQASARRTNSFQRFDIRNAYATKELSGYPTAIQCTLDAEQSHCPIRERYHAYSTVNDVNNVGTEQKQKSSVIIDNQLTNLVISLARLHGDNKRRGQRGVAGGLLSPMVNFNQRDEYDVYKALK